MEKPEREPCPTCGHPPRVLWPFAEPEGLRDRFRGNWIFLKECPQCSELWAEVPHEPFASFPILARWPYDEATFRALNARDEGLILHEWHNAVLRERWSDLPPDEQEGIEAWRDRTYRRYNPIDRTLEEAPPRFVRESREIEEYVDEL